MLNKIEIYWFRQNRKFASNTELKIHDFLSEEKISDRSCFVIFDQNLVS